MDITITELSPETLDALRELAQKSGKTLEEYTRALLERETNGDTQSPIGDKNKWLEEFREWMENLDPKIPNLTDEQISRESIYDEHIRHQ